MADQTITCPKCGHLIRLTEAFTQEIETRLRSEYEQEAKKHQVELQEVLRRKEKELHETLQSERKGLELAIEQRTRESLSVELKDLQDQLRSKAQQLDSARQQELELRKRQRDLEEKEHNLRLEVERTLDRERKAIWEEAQVQVAEEHRLRELEKDKQLGEMRKQIDELKRKAEITSQQSQGEVMEVQLETILGQQFRSDLIEPVPKGMRGADVIQRVHDDKGEACGNIIWESKRTKAWSDGWISKLKDDQRDAKAAIAVIVSTVLPRDVNRFAFIEGVWVTDFASCIGLATALRMHLVQLSYARNSLAGKSEKLEVLYKYLSGNEFVQRVSGIVDAFSDLKEELDAERRAMERIWAKREVQINRVLKNTSAMYGELQAIIGSALPGVRSLELPGGSDPTGV